MNYILVCFLSQGEKDLFGTDNSPSLRKVRAGMQGKNPEAETEVENTEECCLLPC